MDAPLIAFLTEVTRFIEEAFGRPIGHTIVANGGSQTPGLLTGLHLIDWMMMNNNRGKRRLYIRFNGPFVTAIVCPSTNNDNHKLMN